MLNFERKSYLLVGFSVRKYMLDIILCLRQISGLQPLIQWTPAGNPRGLLQTYPAQAEPLSYQRSEQSCGNCKFIFHLFTGHSKHMRIDFCSTVLRIHLDPGIRPYFWPDTETAGYQVCPDTRVQAL